MIPPTFTVTSHYGYRVLRPEPFVRFRVRPSWRVPDTDARGAVPCAFCDVAHFLAHPSSALKILANFWHTVF